MEKNNINLLKILKILKYIYLFLIYFLTLIGTSNAVFISEINFISEEYIEIISNNSLNLSDAYIYDDNGYSKHNKLSLLKYEPNSNFTLIIGNNFMDNFQNNLTNLNCSIYLTSSTQVSNGGLKNQGEEILIEYNSNNSYLKFLPDKNFSFKENQSLHFLKNGSYFINNNSPCKISSPIINNINQTNISNSSIINQNLSFNNQTTNICNFNFSIIPKLNLTREKIDFEFETNLEKDFIIEYWIEDYNKNILKNKFNSSSTSQKTFTPISNLPEIYFIKSNIFYKNCSIIFDEKQIFFYPMNYSNISKEIFLTNITILNKEDLILKQTNKLFYEITRGEISKRVAKIFLNNKEIFSIEPNQKSIVKGNILLELNYSIENIIKIIGFDLEEEISIPKNEFSENSQNNQNKTINNNYINSEYLDNSIKNSIEIIDWINNAPNFYFNISLIGFALNSNKIYFNLTFPKNYNFSSSCKILQSRRVISDIQDNIFFGKNYLLFDQNISTSSLNNSKINCKINPNWRTTPIYINFDLSNFSLDYINFSYKQSDPINLNYDNLTLEPQISSGKNIFENHFDENHSKNYTLNFDENLQNNHFTSGDLNLDKNLEIDSKKSFILEKSSDNNYTSKQLGFKYNSFIGLFIGGIILLIFLLIFK